MFPTFHGMLEGQELDSLASETRSDNESCRIGEDRFLASGECGLDLFEVGKF
jgi:hypothetical protein